MSVYMHNGLPSARKLSPPAVLVLVGVLAILIAGCSSSPTHNSSQALPDSQQIFHGQLVSGSVDIKSMDPAVVQDIYSAVPIEMIFPALLALNSEGMPIPWAATALPTFDANANTYT